MKKVLLSASLVLALGCSNVFANKAVCFSLHGKDSVSREIKEVFIKQFKNAAEVIWTKAGRYQKVSCKIANYQVDAYYTFDGELAGYCRHISKEQLPLAVTMRLNKQFKYPAGFNNIIEVSNAEGNCYWLTVITRTETMRVQVDPQGFVLQALKMHLQIENMAGDTPAT